MGQEATRGARWGGVDEVIATPRSHAEICEEARKNAEYFSSNRERMNYPKFRAMGLCVASGVVEGGCKNIVGARLKQGGMRCGRSTAPTPSSPCAAPSKAIASTTSGNAESAQYRESHKCDVHPRDPD